MVYTVYRIKTKDFAYIGSTSNYKLRISQHKHNCNTEKNKEYPRKLYRTIRSNGGWETADISILCKAKTKRNARQKEERLRKKEMPDLNIRKALR
jgi:predicted GIY-YIG superfamily endonuclease